MVIPRWLRLSLNRSVKIPWLRKLKLSTACSLSAHANMKWRFKIVFRKLSCSTATKIALGNRPFWLWIARDCYASMNGLWTTNSKCDFFKKNYVLVKKSRTLLMPPECQLGMLINIRKVNDRGIFSSVHFCIPWGILKVKTSHVARGRSNARVEFKMAIKSNTK